MPDVVILVDERLVPTLQLADHLGVVRSYAVAAADALMDDWAVELVRLDTAEVHRAARTRAGSWTCSCKDAQYRARRESRLCKHMVCARALWALLRRLTPQSLSETLP